MAVIEEINRARWSLEFARLEESERITEALQQSRVVGLLGEGEVGKTETIRAALGPSLPENPIIRMDLSGAASESHLAFRAARQLVGAELGVEFSTLKVGALVPASLERKRVELAELLGTNGLEEALRDWPSGSFGLVEALKGIERFVRRRDTIVWIDHLEAPSLTPRHPLDLDKFLWGLREMVQNRGRLSVVLSGRVAIAGHMLSQEAAFHQQGHWLSLDNPPGDVWEAVATSLKIPQGLVAELVALTGGHPETMLVAMANFSRGTGKNADELLGDLASTSASLAGRAFQHACTLHRLGGKILEQVALGRGPYATAQRGDSAPQEIRKVLGRLQLAGLIRHDSGWSIVNPLLGILLRREVSNASAPDWDWELDESDLEDEI